MKLKPWMIIILAITSIVAFEVILAYNNFMLPLILNTLHFFITDYIEPMYFATFFAELEHVQKFKEGFPYYHESASSNGEMNLYLEAVGENEKQVSFHVTIKNNEDVFYELFCTSEIYQPLTSDLESLNQKLDACIDKYGQVPNGTYRIPNPV